MHGVDQSILGLQGLKKLGFLDPEWPNVLCVAKLSHGNDNAQKEVIFYLGKNIYAVKERFFMEFPDVFPMDGMVEPLTAMTGPPMKIELVPDAKLFKRYIIKPT